MQNYKNQSFSTLLKAIASLQTPEECGAFFEDLCTIKELQDMSQRLEAAILLDRKCSYQQVSAEVGISAATICRVSRCLNYGSGGYRIALDRLNETENEENDN